MCGIWGVPAPVSEDVAAVVARPIGSCCSLLSIRLMPSSGTGLEPLSRCRLSSMSETELFPGSFISVPLWPDSRADNFLLLFLC